MNSVIFLILRQMRGPLLLLSAVYAVATLGLTLIPGVDDEGNTWHMSFFHAFYFVSFMGTTIGFGEIPYTFTDAQRLWALVFLYITVATWIYTIGALISLLGNESLKQAILRYRFELQVRLISEPFFLICGYGDTGRQLARSLRVRQLQSVVLDIRQERIDALLLEDDPMYVPGLTADAGDPDNLILAGLTHPSCEAVVAITNDNAVNLHIAISAKVLRPSLGVICRADSHEVESNMASFGTDYIIDPYDQFAKNLALAINAPFQYLLVEWFRAARGEPLSDIKDIPRGLWVVCGFGRFGRAIHAELSRLGIPVRVIEPNADIPDLPPDVVIGPGTEAPALQTAKIEKAVGIIAGSDDDSNNLSIIVTALELNPDLFTIVRQTNKSNTAIFDSSPADIVMEPSDVIASKIRTLLTNRLIDDFLSLARTHDNEWARVLAEQLKALSPDRLPHTWAVTIDESGAAAVHAALEAGNEVRIEHLLQSHLDRARRCRAMVLLHANKSGTFCMPSLEQPLAPGDRLLFAGTPRSESQLRWNLANEIALHYVRTGETLPRSAVFRWLAARR